MSTVKELLQAHHYWRLKGLTADLVLLNTYPPTYLQELNDELQQAVADIQLFGAPDQIQMIGEYVSTLKRKEDYSLDPLLFSMRASLRKELQETEVTGRGGFRG